MNANDGNKDSYINASVEVHYAISNVNMYMYGGIVYGKYFVIQVRLESKCRDAIEMVGVGVNEYVEDYENKPDSLTLEFLRSNR